LDKEGLYSGVWVPLVPHALDVLLQIFICDVSVDIMEMVEKRQARHVAEAGDGVAHHGEEYGWYRGDGEIAEDGICIMPKDELCEEGLLLAFVLPNFGVCGLVLVYWEGWRWGGDLERAAADAALFFVCGIDGEGQVAMDSFYLRRVDRCGVGVGFNMREEDGGEVRLCVGVANSRQHGVGGRSRGATLGFFGGKEKFSDEKKSSSSIVECKTTN
jgi:hypothetical protein